ncbi:MAG: Wadjet anti-phage system protein JetD domain-containing protein, partial [Terriglobales bacterium]
VVSRLVASIREQDDEISDIFAQCGLRRLPELVRIRLLDPELRRACAGLSDISAPIGEIAALNLAVRRAFIVENLQTGLAFEDLPGAIVIIGAGYGTSFLSRLEWLSQAECFYWGDLDTHGFAILSEARSSLTHLESILMDETTLLSHQNLWVNEQSQCSAVALPHLSHCEHIVYDRLKQNHWGDSVRLEQERIDWNYAWSAIRSRVLPSAPSLANVPFETSPLG